MTVRQSFAFLRADPNKHVEHVKPSYTAPFDVLTFEILSRETVFQKVDVFEYWKRWLQAAPFFLPTFFRYFGTGLRLTSFLVLIVVSVFLFTLQHQTGQTRAVGLPVVQLVEEV